MTQWTDSARRCFDEYCERARQNLGGGALDINEVLDDLLRHVDEEVRAASLTVVTEEDLRRLLAKIGDPALLQDNSATPSTKPAAEEVSPPDHRRKPGFLLLTLGVILPAITLLFELFTGMSAGVLFDPIPSWPHVAIVALVPISNLWIWLAGRRGATRHATWLGWLNGAALGTSLFYALLYVPFTPFAAIAVIYFGMGLIPLSPLIATIATPLLRVSCCRSMKLERLPGVWGGLLAATGLLVALQLSNFLTLRGLANAASDDPVVSRSGVQSLRSLGDEELLLRACYGQLGRNGGEMDILRWLATGRNSISSDQAREVYYRVTGRPFNTVPPPSLYTRSGRWKAFEEEFTWDDALGGDAVAGRVKGLSLTSSRLDAVAESGAALTYCEWTMEFKNVSSQQREGRAQIALPPGGVVSRLTLWVDGEEREAAFSGRSAVKEAYRQVAVVQRRDPVLVTTCGPDRVLMQCFPVPPNGGVMKVRLGITAPLMLESLDQGRFLWPRFLERNFALAAQLKHSLWIESSLKLEGAGGTLTQSTEGKFGWRHAVTETELAGASPSVMISRKSEVREVWYPAQIAGEFIKQTIVPADSKPLNRLVLVVDGSVGMSRFLPELADALATLNESAEVSAIVAGDEPRVLLDKPQKPTPQMLADLDRQLRRLRCVGGQDNIPALEKAWDLAAESEHGAVLWIHAPQPVLLTAADALRQRLERSGDKVQVRELQVSVGPDRVVEKLDGLASVQHAPRVGTLKSDLAREFAILSGKQAGFAIRREALSTQPATGSKAGTRNIERLWAREEVSRMMATRDYAAATELAGRQQIVTPCSGAVVLETRQQFEQNKLTPADPKSVPAIPEPETWLLLAIGMALLLLCRKRRQLSRG